MMKLYDWISDKIELIKKLIFMYQYKRQLKMRIEKNDFGRNEEW